MKTIALLTIIAGLFLSCNKETATNTYKVSYTVTGDFVGQVKITQGSTEIFMETPFSGIRDTTYYIDATPGTVLKLSATADNPTLSGSITVDGALRAMNSDPDLDGDSTTQIQMEYTLPKQ